MSEDPDVKTVEVSLTGGEQKRVEAHRRRMNEQLSEAGVDQGVDIEVALGALIQLGLELAENDEQ